MRRNFTVGILREGRKEEKRAPLTPADVGWLRRREIKTEIISSPQRIFSDNDYRRHGARVVSRFKNARLLLGIKEPSPRELERGKIYMVFSHTCKGQPQNMSLLASFLKKKITLIDYEKITSADGRRRAHFGRFAGICGMVDGLYYLGKRLEAKGIANPFSGLQPAHKYRNLSALRKAVVALRREIRKHGLPGEISPFIVGITGHGRVSRGAQEILELLHPQEIHPRDGLAFVHRKRKERRKVYKVVFLREEKFRRKNGQGFYFEEYLAYPRRFESNLDIYLPYLNLLVHTSYWDRRFPRLVSKETIKRAIRKRPFRLEFIADVSCDINGSIEFTRKTTTFQKPVFTYDPWTGRFRGGYDGRGIAVLAVDNLPSELPRDSSRAFSRLIRDYVYQIAAHGASDITRHVALPSEIRRAAVVERGQLTRGFCYLKKYLREKV